MPNGKPYILVIWGDDIGITNLSCCSDGLMGYRTPNVKGAETALDRARSDGWTVISIKDDRATVFAPGS